MSDRKPILCLDFDGVLHSYTTPWKNARTIADGPVPGAIEWLLMAMRRFDVAILSSRSHQFLGRWAMKRWLRYWLDIWFQNPAANNPPWVVDLLDQCGMQDYDYWGDVTRPAINKIMAQISFPKVKPPAHITLDDRAVQFTGVFPDLKELAEFKPWNRRTV